MKKIVLFIKIFLIFVITFILSLMLFLSYKKESEYKEKLLLKTSLETYGKEAPRGNIYDKNGVLLVGNIITNDVVFHYTKGIDIKKVSQSLSKIFFLEPLDSDLLIWYKAYHNEDEMLSVKEKQKVKERKISSGAKEEIIDERILALKDTFTDEEKYEARIYGLLSKGYLYESKTIVSNITDEQVNEVLNASIPGVSIEKGYKRYYPYGNTLKDILGSVKKITKENKMEYLLLGYNLNDEVGISGLEKYYENYLKGEKAKYTVNDDYSLTLLEKEKKGSDLYLSIDIKMQEKVDSILEENLAKAKKHPNTEYLSDSYVIVSNPNTSEVLAISGRRYLKDHTYNDVAINNLTSSYTMGSVVKGATISVGYKYDLIDPYKKVYDSCVKLYAQNPKCSFTPLGYLNAITALKQSSNYYQFLIAIALTGQKYVPNMKLNVSEKEFNIYRDMLASYGLGELSGIDHPSEKEGIKGSKIAGDLLLNLAIGQYDTYTPINLLTYINTLAMDGTKRSPSIVSYIKKGDEIIYENKHEIKGEVDISKEQIALIQEGFHEVMQSGTGSGFMNHDYDAAGKTGTAETFLDTNDDGVVDTATLNLTMAAYFPYKNPKYSFVIVSPSASHTNHGNSNIYFLNAYISRDLSNFLFENM